MLRSEVITVPAEDFIWHVGDIGYMDDSYAHSPVRQAASPTVAAGLAPQGSHHSHALQVYL